VTKLQQSPDVEAIADRARALWRDAVGRASTGRVELFAKVALRSRATRDLDGMSATFDRVFESGLALRVFRAGHDRAGFAAASGLSADVVRWAADTACTYLAQAPASAPSPSHSVAAERWDLDAAISLPSEETLTTGLIDRPHLEWVEAGTTVEVLIGAEGWLAARRRHRLWALAARPGARLVAQRGFAGWEHLLDFAGDAETLTPRGAPRDPEVLIVTPEAASSLVAVLADAFHGTGSPGRTTCGRGWSVADEPGRPDGLAGGAFDDAGFPARSLILAAGGLWVDHLRGPGTFRRASFREPPKESATNLVMPPGEAATIPVQAVIARRCRVLRPSSELWVLELELVGVGNGDGLERRWVRVRPQALLEACASRVGPSRVTPEGPIVPALLFEGLVDG
jgi:hypothetical protein